MVRRVVALAVVGVACGARSDLSPPPGPSCATSALAERPCRALAFGVTPVELATPSAFGDQLLDRGDHVDAITGTSVTSLVLTDSSITVTGTRDAPDLCGPLAPSGGLFASLCNDPYTVVRVYDGSYARLLEKEIATPSVAQQIVGGPSSWLAAWDGFAATVGSDGELLVDPVSEPGSFARTACGFVAVGETSWLTPPVALQADFDAPSSLATFDTASDMIAALPPTPWPYDGASVAFVISPDAFTSGPTFLEVVGPSGASRFASAGGDLYATPMGLVMLQAQSSGFLGAGPLGATIIGPDGATTASLTVDTTNGYYGGARAVWSGGALLVVWVRSTEQEKPTVFGATLRCAD